MTAVDGSTVDLITGIAWPVVVLFLGLVLARPLLGAIRALAPRISKISVFDVSLEIATLSEFRPTWAEGLDVRKLTPSDIFDSYTHTLFSQLERGEMGDYAVVDLGRGKEWLTSRLYLFAVLLRRMRGVRTFVFVETEGTRDRCYVGNVATDLLRWTLSREYPWLETSFAAAYKKVTHAFQPTDDMPGYISTQTGGVPLYDAQQLSEGFVAGIQRRSRPPEPRDDWVQMSIKEYSPKQDREVRRRLYEHASWIEGELIRSLLGNRLETAAVYLSPLKTREDRVAAMMDVETDFVALFTRDGAFDGLVDRVSLADAVALHSVRQARDSAPKTG